MSVTNDLAEVVPRTVDRIAEDHPHIRECPSCRDDVIALAMSTLHPGFSSSDMGRILKRIASEKAKGKTEVTVAVIHAIETVEHNPHHTG